MSTWPGDYLVELLRWAPGADPGAMTPLDITDRVDLQGFGSINRAVERSFLSFKTGDLTLSLVDEDGFVSQLFGLFGATDRWQLRVTRRDAVIFCGLVLGQGSVTRHELEREVELTVYGLTKVLDEASAEPVQRFTRTALTQPVAINQTSWTVFSSAGFEIGATVFLLDATNLHSTSVAALPDKHTILVNSGPAAAYLAGAAVVKPNANTTVTTATSGQSTVVLSSTLGLATGDVLHLTDHVNDEDVTVKQVTSATGASLESVLQHTYAPGSPVLLATPYHRYKTPDYLVRQLFAAAGMPLAEVRVSGSLFRRLAPTPVNRSGLDLTAFPYASPAEKGGQVYVTLATGQRAGPGTYRQASPDADWVKDDSTAKPWIDWSRYFRQDGHPVDPGIPGFPGVPAIVLRNALAVKVGVSGGVGGDDAHLSGYDHTTLGVKGAITLWHVQPGGAAPRTLNFRTSADGVTWGASTTEANLGGEGDSTVEVNQGYGCEFDPRRFVVYCWWRRAVNGAYRFRAYNTATGVWTDMLQADDTGKSYFGAVYVPELDAVLALRGSSWNGPAFEIAAFRGFGRLWVRPFPSCLVVNEDAAIGEGANYPTLQLRWVNGSLYCLAISDGKLQLVRSDDQFQSYVMRPLVNATTKTYYFGGRVLGQYVVAAYEGAVPRTYVAAAPFYAGVVSYADFAGKTVADALQELAVVVNAVFWVDDDLQGHFVARDLLPSGEIRDLTQEDLVLTSGETQLWDEARQHATVSGGGFEATAGDASRASDDVSVSSDLIPNAAYCQSMADQYLDFYSKLRALKDATVFDDGTLRMDPLGRVLVDGRRFYILESDHSPTSDEWSVKLLEDLENAAP